MYIQTDRLIIRDIEEDDAYAFASYRDKEEVAKYQSWKHFTLKDAQKRIKYCIVHSFKGEVKDNTQLSIIYHDMIIGDLRIEVLSKTTITIGYTIDSAYWHQGFAREAVLGLLKYIKSHYEYTKVIAYIYKANKRSRDLLLYLGFKKFDESFFYKDEGYMLELKDL